MKGGEERLFNIQQETGEKQISNIQQETAECRSGREVAVKSEYPISNKKPQKVQVQERQRPLNRSDACHGDADSSMIRASPPMAGLGIQREM